LKGKNIHIIGVARSGLAAAEVLLELGARVTAHDRKPADALPDIPGVEVRAGESAYEGIGEADLVVTSPGVPETSPGIAAACRAGVPILPEIELAYRISPAPIIAVTGTNGKTTTTALIGAMLRESGRKTFIAGNIVAGDIRLPLVKAAHSASASDVIVAEISSFQLELISSFAPKVAALLNITGDHMDRYPDMESYARAKARIFEYQTEDDHAVLNADDPAVMRFAPERSRIRLFSATREVEHGAFLRGSEVWVGDRMVCDTRSMKLRGRHNLENVLAAAAAVSAFGETGGMQRALDSFEAPEHRLEPVAEVRGVEFLNNSMCTNVAASVSSLAAVGRPAVVIAGGKDKGSEYGPLGEAFIRYAKHVVLIGQDAPLIERAARAAGFDKLSRASSMEEAVEKAWSEAETGDTVLLSPGCASFDMFDDFEHRGRVFKDAVRALVKREAGNG
ncbi:MAG: UDP-N-acetylmuramoyl-L-alanine--D-glutamate ligase, partial [Armatimonadota bacterium]